MQSMPGRAGACVVLTLACLEAAAATVSVPLAPSSSQAPARVAVLVELEGPPAARVYGDVLRRSAPGGVSAARDAAAAAAYVQSFANRTRQDAIVSQLVARAGATELYRVTNALNAVAVLADPSQLPEISALPGVRSARLLRPRFPTNASSVPFIGAPAAWAGTPGAVPGLTGAGVRIGIIDTGIDYVHSDFGGTGNLADYQANDPTAAVTPFFPSAKVVGGVDLAGDSYDGTNVPVPDPNPMDCYGHGTHVAGTAAGFGVNADGSTYAGPYGPSVPFSSLRIGPGVAPRALLYGIRIFGCGGGSVLAVQGIDWALDPNGDGDLSDHLDVVNMSFGDDFGDPLSPDAVAADNAAWAGVVAVASAGNGGDAYFIHGSPGSGARVVSVANAGDPGVAASVLTVTSPASIAGSYATQAGTFWNATPPHPPAPSGQSGTVVAAVDATLPTGDGCQPLTNAAEVAGRFALVDSGGCDDNVKLNNVNLAGATGLIVANVVPGDPDLAFMGGLATPAAHIPSVFVSEETGRTLRAHLAEGVQATFALSTWADRLYFASSLGPSRAGAVLRAKPDVTAPGLMIESARSGATCRTSGCYFPDPSGFLPGNQSFFLSGTSMAAPHVAGTMALLRERHRDWTPEQLKAVVMSSALQPVTTGSQGTGPAFAPDRAGAGRVSASGAAGRDVYALDADGQGLVSLSFDAAVAGSRSEVKRVRLVNAGTTARRFEVAIDTLVDAPGVDFSLPGGSVVTLPAGTATEVEVRMDADAARMRHARDPAVSPAKPARGAFAALGTLPRHWLTSESGFVAFREGGATALRVPLYAAAVPTARMAAVGPLPTAGAPTGSGTLALAGQDVCTGTRVAGPGCTGTFPLDEVSVVSPFELQAVSGRAPASIPGYADLQYAGVAYRAGSGEIVFGVSTWERWSSPTEVAVNVYVDTNLDGTWDKVLFNSNPGALSVLSGSWQPQQDSFVAAVFDVATRTVTASPTQMPNRASAAALDTRLFDNRVLFLPATAGQLGLASGSARFRYKVATCPGWAPLCGVQLGAFLDEVAGPFTWDPAAQGLDFSGSDLSPDLAGGTLPVSWNLANLSANGSLGALLLHHHNAEGLEAQVVPLGGAPTADLGVAVVASPSAPAVGQSVQLTVTATNSGPASASGVSVEVALPPGLAWASDDGAGAFSPASGLWTLPDLAPGASRALRVTTTVGSSDPLVAAVTIASRGPLDPIPANDRAWATVQTPRSADLAMTMGVSSRVTIAGAAVTYTIAVRNLGPDTAWGLSALASFDGSPLPVTSGHTASDGVFDPASGRWDVASLAPGAGATLTWTVIAPDRAGPLTCRGNVASSTPDPLAANDAGSATTFVEGGAPLVPTLSSVGLGLLGGLIALAALLRLRS